MELKKSPSSHLNELQKQQQVEQIPNRSTPISRSSQLIPTVTTNRKHYMEEDELNKNISSEYQDIQIRTLTKWMNVQLSKVGEHIINIDKDLRDGKKLLKLLSVVANNPNLKPERGSMRIHELSNVAQALKFLQEQWGADSLPAVANEAIVNGDVKSTLAITFFIMLKYQIQPILLNKSTNILKLPPSSPMPSLSNSRTGTVKPMAEAKLALLYWVRQQLEDYISNHIISSIQDFSRSWRSGLAFCLLVHRHDPDLIPILFSDLIQYSSNKDTWYKLLTVAFDVAEEKLDIPKYLEPADLLVEFPHEPSVMMYVSEMYKVMNHQDEKRDKRMHDISTVIDDALPSPLPLPPPQQQPTPPDSNANEEDDDDDVAPETPHPETIDCQNISQQLDTLESYIHENLEDDVEKSRVLLDQIITKSNLSTEEKQVLVTRYNQLKADWELITRKRPVQQHISTYVKGSPLFKQLHDMIPRNEQKELIHPLDGTLSMAEEFERSLSQVVIENDDDDDDDNTLSREFESTQRACKIFRRGVMFAQITLAINEELDVIQKIMADSGASSVTDELIQGLEKRIHIVNATIQGVRDEYQEDLLSDLDDPFYGRFIDCIDSLEDRYETVRDWVDQVRVWFVEAERIRTWIDKHIKVIEERNEADTFDPLSREMTVEDSIALELHQQHEQLKQEIDRFDSDDMDRLRAHVKMLTHSTDAEKELTPADTSTIEITLTTLNMLSHLTKLLDNRSHLLQLLLLRVKWEDLFGNAVQWIVTTDQHLDQFLRGKARWSEKEVNYATPMDESDQMDEGGVEDVIKTLVSLERKISDFDHATYSEVLDSYQEMETLYNQNLPDYLEARQVGFEKAFEDLMKRSGFSRKVVEQLLSMISTVEKFKELRDMGEKLRQHLLKDTASSVFEDDDIYAEKVQTFKEDSARLITNASTCIPYPVVPKMSTAIGANDAHDTEMTNELIKSTVSTYSMSLALIADALDQLLTSRYQVMSLQSRAEEAFETMTRTKNWIDERVKLLKKARFDVMLYDTSFTSLIASATTSSNDSTDLSQLSRKNSINHTTNQTSSASNDSATINYMEELQRLEKERDSIALRLHQMETDELAKLFATVRNLEYDVDASNAVSIDRDALVNCVESLENSHQELKQMLGLRGFQLDALKKRVDWENQWSKSNSHLQTVVRKMCDFNIKKVRYDPAKENTDKPSYQGDNEISQSLQFLQDRVVELDERYLLPLAEIYDDLVTSYNNLITYQSKNNNNDSTQSFSVVPDFITNKQSDIKVKYDDLKHLSTYTAELATQRATIIEFLLRARDAHHEGEKIKDVVSKKTRRIMANEEEEGLVLDSRISKFKQEIASLWSECGKNMTYPVYNGTLLKSSVQNHHNADSNVTNSAYRSQVRAQIKILLDKKMEELGALEKAIDQCIETYRDADRMKALVNQYEQQACELGIWVNEQLELLRNQYVDVSAEVFLPQGINIKDLKNEQENMLLKADDFENLKVLPLHDRIAELVEESVEKKKNQSVDVSSAARQLGQVMEQLSHLKRGLSDQAVTLEAATKRLNWEKILQSGIKRLEEMNDQVRQFTAKKNQVIAQDEISFDQVQDLQEDLTRLAYQKNKFLKSTLPGIQLHYDDFVEYFPKLSRPMATPDHLEGRMESLNRSCTRLQENVEARSKELELIKQRMKWEDIVKKAIAFLTKQETMVENFVEEKARWQNDTVASQTNDQDEETLLRTEWADLYNSYRNYQDEMIIPLRKRFEEIVDETNDHYNNSSTSLLPNSFMKKMQDVQTFQDRTDYYFKFSNEIITQRCLVSAFILRTAQLEQSAELIREEFITTKLHSNSAQNVVSLLESHSDRLEKFKAGIDDLKNHLATSIPFPVRSLDNISIQAKIRDETTNSVIKETIELRNTRLDELWSMLQQLLESKERVSRRRLSLHSYKKQAKVTKTWIDSRRETLTSHMVSSEKDMDMDKLKDIVSQVDSIEQAMRANDNLLTALTLAYEKCVSAFNDKSLDSEESQQVNEQDQQSLVQELEDVVEPTQVHLVQDWNKLFEEVIETNKSKSMLLMEYKVQAWLKALDSLFKAVDDTLANESNIITDDKITLFMNELNQLKNIEHLNLKSDLLVETNKKSVDEDQLAVINQKLDCGLEISYQIQDKITCLQNKLQLNQWITKYIKDISELQALIGEQLKALVTIYENHKTISVNSTSENRYQQHQTLVAKYKLITDLLTDLRDNVDNVTSQHSAIMEKNTNSFDNYDHQGAMMTEWNKLITEDSNVSLLVGRSSKWINLFDLFDQTKLDIQSIEHVDNSDQFDLVLEKVSKIQSYIHNELTNIGNDLINDALNYKPYESERSSQLEKLNVIKANINVQLKQNEKLGLIQLLKDQVEQLLSILQTQLSITEKRCERFDYTGKNSTNESNDLIEKNNSVLSNCKNEFDSLVENQCSKLLKEYGCSEDEINQILQPVSEALEMLNYSIVLEQQHLDLESKLQQYLANKSNIIMSIDDQMNKLSAGTGNKLSEQSVVADVEYQLESIEESIQDLQGLYNLIANYEHKDMKCYNDCFETTLKTVDHEQNIISVKLADLKNKLNETKDEIDALIKHQQIISQLSELLQFITSMISKVESFQITTGKNASTEERELNELCSDFYQSYNKKRSSVNSLLESYTKGNSKIQQLEQQIESAMEKLETLIDLKKKEVSHEGDLTGFLKIMKEFNKEIASLTTVINHASPHYSSIVNNKFVKSDLQLLLKTLVSEFKQYKKTINELIDQAKAESKRQYLEDNDRVKDGLQKAIKRWAQAQSSAAARERELQTCINQLDHEFFTKLAIAKTTPHITHRVLQSSSQTFKKQSNGLRVTSPIPPIVRSNGSKRPSKTPSVTKHTPYVPDPDNELDMKLGQIVNSFPYRITVKIVPDQVGKYWFGDVNPRLVYCRILPSQLVMVRVGGGWVELSKFLKEHGLLEGTYSRPGSVNENPKQQQQQQQHSEFISPYQEAYLHTVRSSSPSGRITIRGGGGINRSSSSLASTRSSNKSSGMMKPSMSGYVDGDTFVSIDESGNQLFVKMKKADDDAKTPVVNKRKH